MLEAILYKPIFNVLIFIYEHLSFGDLGLAIIIVTVLVRCALLPLSVKNAKDQTIMQRIAPKIKEIQEKHKGDRTKQAEEIMKIYEEHKVNPGSVMFLLIIQGFIGLGLFRVFSDGIASEMDKWLYSFIPRPETLNFLFLGTIDLKATSLIIAASALLVQGGLSWLSVVKHNKIQNKGVLVLNFVLPMAITFIFLRFLPSAIGLYWLTTTLFSAIQQLIINKSLNKDGRQNGRAEAIS